MEKKRESSALKYLSELVSIQSYGKIDKNHAIIKYLKEAFSDCNEIKELEDSNGNVHLLIGVNHDVSNIDNAIVLSGHIDTVMESEGHSCSISLVSNIISGLGTSDMKSFFATIIANLDYLKNLDIPVVISITSDEETNLKGISKVIKELKIQNVIPSLVIVGEPTDLDYYISSRGNSVYVDVMSGIACHSGTPELGINAIELSAKFIMEIQKMSKQYEKEASICITSIKGGKSPSNVVPDESSLCFGVRTSNSKVLDTIYNYLVNKHAEISKNYGESAFFNVVDIPPFERKDNEFINEQAALKNKNIVDARYATEAGYFQVAYPNSTILIYGPGCPENIHKPGESISINNLYQYQEEMIDFINNYGNYMKKQENKRLILLPEKSNK